MTENDIAINRKEYKELLQIKSQYEAMIYKERIDRDNEIREKSAKVAFKTRDGLLCVSRRDIVPIYTREIYLPLNPSIEDFSFEDHISVEPPNPFKDRRKYINTGNRIIRDGKSILVYEEE